MAEYICREAIIDDLEKEIEAGNVALDEDVWINKGLRIAIRDIKDIKTADVQPVNQWISVKDRLPDEDGWYLVYKHNRVRVAEWCKDCWYNESDLPIDDCAITHWQLLPEPPKEGEYND